MVTKPEPDSSSWLTPVYGEKKEDLEQYAVCKHCNDIRRNHAGDEEKCLFDSTTFVVKMDPRVTKGANAPR